MKKIVYLLLLSLGWFTACTHRPTAVEQRRIEKHAQDSIALLQQQRSLLFYQTQLDSLLPVSDSLIALFRYEKNDKYQDHGFYVTSRNNLRILVQDDGTNLLLYRDGKRLPETNTNLHGKEQDDLNRAQHLLVTIRDIRELEQRIQRTSLEIQKYQKRLNK